MIQKYPRPSGAEIAAQLIVDNFKNKQTNLKSQLIEENKKIKDLNREYNKYFDYLQNDYYGAVASCALVNNNIFYWAYICDCEVIVYDKNGNIKFKTEDDKEKYSDPFINKIGFS
jgi:serine/threonine protein phosphatase PrpC